MMKRPIPSNSGIEVPLLNELWTIRRLKFILNKLKRPIKQDDGVVTAYRDGIVTLRANRRMDGYTFADKEIGYQGVEPQDIVIHGMDGFAGAIGLSDSRGKCSPVYIVLEATQGQHPLYWSYYLQNLAQIGFILSLAKGIRERSTDFRWNVAGNLIVHYPNYIAQRRIASFLDKETSRIDTLIEKKERQIELLQEKRQAIITHAVTKGLDPNAKMKDSGVEWIGEIPEGWEIRRLRHVVSLRSGSGITSDEIENEDDFPVYGGNGLRGYFSNYTHEGDYVLIGRQGALCGNINYASGRFWASEHAVVATSMIELRVTWLGEILRIMNLNQYSISAAQPGLAVDRIKDLRLPVPPIREQIEIENQLKDYFREQNELSMKIQKSIDLLKEYRSSLITHAVTGQIDIENMEKVK